jgi:hypothetical protein
MDRVEVIERTLRCYQAGWWSLVPVVGLGPAIVAFYYFARVRAATRNDWNPASTQLRVGLMLATIGCGLSLLLVSIGVSIAIYEGAGK